MNNFIVSGKGFLKSTEFNKETMSVDIEWTQILRDAQKFNSKTAVELINKNELEAFVWNPYKEEPVKGKWEIHQRQKHYDFFNDESHKSLEWKPIRVTMESKTDLKYLQSKGIEKNDYYDSYDEALKVCQKKNKEIIIELKEKIKELNKQNINLKTK